MSFRTPSNPPPTPSPNGLSAERTQIEPQELRERAQGLRKHEFPAAFAVDCMWARQGLEIAADQIAALQDNGHWLTLERERLTLERDALRAKLEKAVGALKSARKSFDGIANESDDKGADMAVRAECGAESVNAALADLDSVQAREPGEK